MSRDVKIREGAYQEDVAYLSRLARAVQKDPKLRPAEKKRIGERIHALILLLVNATYGKALAL